MNHYHLAQVVTPSGTIGQISDQSVDTGIQEYLSSTDGQVDPTYCSVMQMKPMFRFTTSSLAIALGYCGINGLAMSGSGVDFYFQKASPGGTRDTTACVKFATTNGLITLDSINVSENGIATATYSVYAVSSDGTTAPLAVTSGVTLPTQLSARACWTLGPAKINGTTILGLKSTSLATGMQAEVDGDQGFVYPTLAYILGRAPRFSLGTTNLELIASLTMAFNQTATDSLIYFTKMAEGSYRVANATAEHISFSIDQGMTIFRNAGGSHGSAAMASADLICTYDGTNGIVVPNLATAIA